MVLSVAFCVPESKADPKAKPGLLAAAYSAPIIAAPGVAAYSPYTAYPYSSPYAYSAGYVASPYAAAYPAYSPYSAPLVVV